MMDNARQTLRLFETPAFRQAAGLALRPGGLGLTERMLALCRFPAGARLLDVGCGRGASLALLRSRGFQAAGVDRSPELLAEAETSWATAGPVAPPPLVRADGGRLPFRPGVFDGLLCECVLSLLPDRPTALREFHAALAEGGLLALCDVCLLPDRRGSNSPIDDVSRLPGGESAAASAAPREVSAIQGEFSPDRASCLDGAAEPDRLKRELADAGFRLLVWEDHRRLLAELAARLVFALSGPSLFGPLEASGAAPKVAGASGCGCGRKPGASLGPARLARLLSGRSRGRFGYFLAVAAKGPAERGRFHAGRGGFFRP